MMFSAYRTAVENLLTTSEVASHAQFGQLIRDELAEISLDMQPGNPDHRHLQQLYELRARVLDWELGTGYLGFFSPNPGTRYTFTRRLDVVLQMIADTHRSQKLRVLEIGCGAGLLCLEFAQRSETVVGIDISHVVLDFANHVKDALQYPNVSFQHGDAEHLAFRDGAFDLIICSEVLEHLLSPQTALREMRRVLAEDGVLILSTPCAASLSDWCMNLFRLVHTQLESEKDVHFDKKTYLALQRQQRTQDASVGDQIEPMTFMRIHERFHYHALLTMFQETGFQVRQTEGTVFAFPPHYQVFYRYCPNMLLPLVRQLERLLNRLRIFQKFGAVTTCFRLQRAQGTTGSLCQK